MVRGPLGSQEGGRPNKQPCEKPKPRRLREHWAHDKTDSGSVRLPGQPPEMRGTGHLGPHSHSPRSPSFLSCQSCLQNHSPLTVLCGGHISTPMGGPRAWGMPQLGTHEVVDFLPLLLSSCITWTSSCCSLSLTLCICKVGTVTHTQWVNVIIERCAVKCLALYSIIVGIWQSNGSCVHHMKHKFLSLAFKAPTFGPNVQS